MLKKILGQAPFDVSLEDDILIVPDRNTTATLGFENVLEYDLPLSCSIRLMTSVRVDACEFDVMLPAEGKTKKELVFSMQGDSKIFGGSSVCELEIIDRILDSKTVYELEIKGEMAYKCSESKSDEFSASDEAVFTRDGRFFANKGETVSLEIPSMSEFEIGLSVPSGKIRDFAVGQLIKLESGLNRLSFQMTEDGCFEFVNPVSGEIEFLQTLNPKYFI